MIYFIQAGINGPIKIGFVSGDTLAAVQGRLDACQTGNAETLRLLAVCEGKIGRESAIHRKFAASRVRGEWFLATTDLLKFIETEAISLDVALTKQRSCVICDTKFVPSKPSHTRCSAECRQKKRCIICGKVFFPETWWKKFYCSIECHQKGN